MRPTVLFFCIVVQCCSAQLTPLPCTASQNEDPQCYDPDSRNYLISLDLCMNDTFVRQHCPRLCNICQDYTTPAPTEHPTFEPSSSPILLPSSSPTLLPTPSPTLLPTLSPSHEPNPTIPPSASPTSIPSSSPSVYTCSDGIADNITCSNRLFCGFSFYKTNCRALCDLCPTDAPSASAAPSSFPITSTPTLNPTSSAPTFPEPTISPTCCSITSVEIGHECHIQVHTCNYDRETIQLCPCTCCRATLAPSIAPSTLLPTVSPTMSEPTNAPSILPSTTLPTRSPSTLHPTEAPSCCTVESIEIEEQCSDAIQVRNRTPQDPPGGQLFFPCEEDEEVHNVCRCTCCRISEAPSVSPTYRPTTSEPTSSPTVPPSDYPTGTPTSPTQPPTFQPTMLPTIERCNCDADIMFVLDSSFSIGTTRFENECLPFVTGVAERFYVSESRSRIGVTSYSRTSTVDLLLNETFNSSYVLSLEHKNGLTNVFAALKKTVEHFDQNTPVPPHKPRILVLIVDGLFELSQYDNAEQLEILDFTFGRMKETVTARGIMLQHQGSANRNQKMLMAALGSNFSEVPYPLTIIENNLLDSVLNYSRTICDIACTSVSPTQVPTSSPTSNNPTKSPTLHPSTVPTEVPSIAPSSEPSRAPSSAPTSVPSSLPTERPTFFPTTSPTIFPTHYPSVEPTGFPSSQPTSAPATTAPTLYPTVFQCYPLFPLDIVFLVDASFSVGPDVFRSQLQLAKQLTEHYTDEIDNGHVRAGLVTYSRRGTVEFGFSDFSSYQDLELAFDNAKFVNSTTFIDRGIARLDRLVCLTANQSSYVLIIAFNPDVSNHSEFDLESGLNCTTHLRGPFTSSGLSFVKIVSSTEFSHDIPETTSVGWSTIFPRSGWVQTNNWAQLEAQASTHLALLSNLSFC